jgi:sugar phosphate permease
VGLQFGIQHVGASIAPALFGVIADAYDLYTAFYFLAGTILFANLLIVFMPNEAARQAKPKPATA